MFYITGDIHGGLKKLIKFCNTYNITDKDTIIILGDVGANYFCDEKDDDVKKGLSALGPSIFCIHGNHENRASNVLYYNKIYSENVKGMVLAEDRFPKIQFAIDGEIYEINDQKALVVGGAYSVDKYYRFLNYLSRMACFHSNFLNGDTSLLVKSIITGDVNDKTNIKKANKIIDGYSGSRIGWWKDEQPSKFIKKSVENKLEENDWKVDIVLTHTCPFKYMPVEAFLSSVNQNTVDNSTEKWFDKIEEKLDYKKWYCGHFHIDKKIDNIEFLFDGFDTI